jgi:hypothetical protein
MGHSSKHRWSARRVPQLEGKYLSHLVLVLPSRVTTAFVNDAILLWSPVYLCSLLIAAQQCSGTSFRKVNRRILALRGYGWPSSKDY